MARSVTAGGLHWLEFPAFADFSRLVFFRLHSTLIAIRAIATRVPGTRIREMNAKTYNTKSGGEKLGVSASTVCRWAKRLGLGKKVGAYVQLTPAELAEIGKKCHRAPGNPNFGKMIEN